MDNHNRLSLKENRMGPTFFSIIVLALMGSAIPEWSASIALVNFTLVVISVIIITWAWLKVKNTKVYFSIMSYCFLLIAAVSFSEPVIRMFWKEGNPFWILLSAIWLLVFIVSTIFRKKALQTFKQNPGETKAGVFIYRLLLCIALAVPPMIIVGGSLFQGYFEMRVGLVIAGLAMFVLSLILLVFISSFLNKAKEELPNP